MSHEALTPEEEELALRRFRNWKHNQKIEHEFGLLWEAGDDVAILVGQIEDVDLLREMLVLYVQSARSWHEQYEREREEAER